MLYEELTKSLKRMARLDCEAGGMFSPEEHTAWEAAETIEKLEKQRDELLAALEGLTRDIQGLIDESTGVVGLHLNGDIATWGELEAGGAFEWLTTLPAANDTIEKMKGGV